MPTSKRGNVGMNVQATLEKLSSLRLSGMERSYRALMETRHPQSLTADELIAHLVDAEWDDRQERKCLLASSFPWKRQVALPDFAKSSF